MRYLKYLAILLFFVAPFAHAAIAFNAVSESSQGAGSSWSFNHTCVTTDANTGHNSVMVACFYLQKNPDPGITSVTYNGITLTKSADSPQTDGNANNQNMYLFYGAIGDCDAGAHTVAVTGTGSFDSFTASVATYSGASQTGLPDSHGFTTNTSAVANTTVTSTVVAANSWQVACFRNEIGGATDGTGTTHRGSNGDHTIADSNGALSAGSNSLIQNFSSSQNMAAIISIAPVASAITSGLARFFWWFQ